MPMHDSSTPQFVLMPLNKLCTTTRADFEILWTHIGLYAILAQMWVILRGLVFAWTQVWQNTSWSTTDQRCNDLQTLRNLTPVCYRVQRQVRVSAGTVHGLNTKLKCVESFWCTCARAEHGLNLNLTGLTHWWIDFIPETRSRTPWLCLPLPCPWDLALDSLSSLTCDLTHTRRSLWQHWQLAWTAGWVELVSLSQVRV